MTTAIRSNGSSTRLADDQLSNDAADLLELGHPYQMLVRVKGVAPLIMHRYSTESVKEKGAASKGSSTKKTDDVESYTYRDKDGYLGVPGLCLAAAIREAGRSEADPRSPRKSMRDILRSLVIPVDTVARLEPHTKDWDYLDNSRVVIQRSAVTRTRPAMLEGWEVAFRLLITSSDYLPPKLLRKLCVDAGRFQGLLDFRPTFGRFDVVQFEVVTLSD